MVLHNVVHVKKCNLQAWEISANWRFLAKKKMESPTFFPCLAKKKVGGKKKLAEIFVADTVRHLCVRQRKPADSATFVVLFRVWPPASVKAADVEAHSTSVSGQTYH